jgi:hypothetical protein
VLEDIPKALRIQYARSFDAEQLSSSGESILEDHLSPEQLTELRDRLDRLSAAYEPVEKGDYYTLSYVPGAGSTLSLNETPLVTIPGADFAQAYFSIWLGEAPVKKSIRRALLSDAEES